MGWFPVSMAAQCCPDLRFEGAALIQLNGLPSAAFDARVERVADEPWDATVMPPGDDPAYRMTVFGSGYGPLSFHADGTALIIRIFDIPGTADSVSSIDVGMVTSRG